MKAIKLVTLSALALVSGAAMANTTSTVVDGGRIIFKEFTNPAAVSAEVGTLGYGANVAWAVNDTVELQAGWAGGKALSDIVEDFDVNDVTYNLSTDFSNPYLGVQMRPMANWLTVGAGVIVPDNEITATAQRGQDGYISVKGTKYNASNAEITADIEHKNALAPYLTVGVRPNINNKWGVFGELGAAYMGETDATVKVNGSLTTESGAAVTNSDFISDAESEIESKDWGRWLPIVKVGATYRF